MSHITTIKTQIKDLVCLADACDKIGLKFNKDKTHYKWYGHKDKECLHAISVPGKKGAYEIGVNEGKGGVFTLDYDPFNGGYGLEEFCGKKAEKLIEAYTRAVALKEAKKLAQAEGYTVSEEYDSNTNETIITLRKY